VADWRAEFPIGRVIVQPGRIIVHFDNLAAKPVVEVVEFGGFIQEPGPFSGLLAASLLDTP